jgi:light-regulated signal transduction histidine kinase (bacteriophytochrome)
MEDLKTWSRDDINLLEIAAEMFVNVFERKRTEDLASRYAKELERSNEDLVEFAYHASHDLQEPLRMVSGYCELLDRRCASRLDDDARDLIRAQSPERAACRSSSPDCSCTRASARSAAFRTRPTARRCWR